VIALALEVAGSEELGWAAGWAEGLAVEAVERAAEELAAERKSLSHGP